VSASIANFTIRRRARASSVMNIFENMADQFVARSVLG
jgi:hypothetical protein